MPVVLFIWQLLQPIIIDLLKTAIFTKKVVTDEKAVARAVPSRELAYDRYDALLEHRISV